MWASTSMILDYMFVPWMKTKGALTEATFSWYMTGLSGTTYIDFGTPDPSIIGDGSNIFWMDINQGSLFWENYVYGFKWGSNSPNEGVATNFPKVKAITDTGSSCLVGPSTEVDVIYNGIINLLKEKNAHDGWGHIFWCTEK